MLLWLCWQQREEKGFIRRNGPPFAMPGAWFAASETIMLGAVR